MLRSLLLFCVSFLGPFFTPAAVPDSSAPLNGRPGRDTPKELTQAWLRFHRSELCQDMDADFEFTKDGMKARSLVEDDKSYQKLEELFEPLRNSYHIDLQRTQPPEDAEKSEDKKDDPPPSLWENYELRSFLGDPQARALESADFDETSIRNIPPQNDEILKQRLFIYAEQTLASKRKMERYAKDIAALTHVFLDPEIDESLRLQAGSICQAHAENLGRLIRKLTRSLEPAFPSSSRRVKAAQAEKAGNSGKTLGDRAKSLSEFAQTVSRHVYQFIHPEHFTIGLDELRQPGLLDSLRSLQKMDSDFQTALAKSR